MLGKALRLFVDYYVIPWTTQKSTASFWYPREFAAVRDQVTLENYLKLEVPFYLVDYHRKLSYRRENSEGIIILFYPPPTGEQINPEAAFSYALALCDRYVLKHDKKSRDSFLHYANYFLERQDERGNFNYEFDWYNSKKPWPSALAQSRGASVMLRAFLLTSDEKFRRSALQAVSLFGTNLSEGGFLGSLETGIPYYEEYPQEPGAVINGFMAALFGPWELAKYLQCKSCEKLYDDGLAWLKAMLPLYTTEWWTIYDLAGSTPNYNSPRYHKLIIEYLEIFAAISGDATIREYLARWRQFDTPWRRARASLHKAHRKLTFR